MSPFTLPSFGSNVMFRSNKVLGGGGERKPNQSSRTSPMSINAPSSGKGVTDDDFKSAMDDEFYSAADRSAQFSPHLGESENKLTMEKSQRNTVAGSTSSKGEFL